jgi:type I restriction enzyme R subunit
MAQSVASPNFGFLASYGEPLMLCAARAERYVWDDPNTSLMKVRQLAEMIAKQSAARCGLDPSNDGFSAIVAMLFRNRIVSAEIRDHFEIIRLRGNEAAHNDAGERKIALAALITAHRLAIWFHRVAGNLPEFDPGPFRPPPNPASVEESLRADLEALRAEASEFNERLDSAQHEISELRAESTRLGQEAEASSQYAELLSSVLDSTKESAERERATFERELSRLRAEAKLRPSASLMSFVNRSRAAAQSLGQRGEQAEYLPLAQLRSQGLRKSSCCRAPTILVQSMTGGFVTANCSKCNNSASVSSNDFFHELDIWVSCPKCRKRAGPSTVGRANYGYKCNTCG